MKNRPYRAKKGKIEIPGGRGGGVVDLCFSFFAKEEGEEKRKKREERRFENASGSIEDIASEFFN